MQAEEVEEAKEAEKVEARVVVQVAQPEIDNQYTWEIKPAPRGAGKYEFESSLDKVDLYHTVC